MRMDKRFSIPILILVKVDMLNDVNKCTNILVMNLYRKFSNYLRFVLFAQNFFGKKKKKTKKKIFVNKTSCRFFLGDFRIMVFNVNDVIVLYIKVVTIDLPVLVMEKNIQMYKHFSSFDRISFFFLVKN